MINLRALFTTVIVDIFIVFVVALDKHGPRRRIMQTRASLDTRPYQTEKPRSFEETRWHWERETTERRDKFSRRIFYFTVVATFVAVLAFWESLRQADIAQKALVATGRAWVKISSKTKTATLTWNRANGDLSISTLVDVENKGTSPALDLVVTLVAISSRGPRMIADGPKETKKACFLGLPTGYVLFPGLSNTELSMGIYNRDQTESFTWRQPVSVIRINKLVDPINFDIIACANYKIAGDPDETHITGIRYKQINGSPNILAGKDVMSLPLEEDIVDDYAD